MAQYYKRNADYSERNNDVFEVVMLADKDGNVGNLNGIAANLNLAAGVLTGYTFEHVNGAVPAMAQNGTGTLWDVNSTIYPWATMNLGGTLTITCSNGAIGHSIIIDGLDNNYDHQQEVVALTALTVTTTKSWKRIHSAIYSNGITANANDITIARNGTTVAKILAGRGKTHMAITSIPRGHTGFVTKGTASCAASSDATVDMYIKYDGQTAYFSGHSFEISGGGQYTYDFTVPMMLPEYSDVDVRATVRSNNSRITAAFDIIIVENSVLGI
jgi:hypothetical protein